MNSFRTKNQINIRLNTHIVYVTCLIDPCFPQVSTLGYERQSARCMHVYTRKAYFRKCLMYSSACHTVLNTLVTIPDNYDLLYRIKIFFISKSTKDKPHDHDRSEWSKHLTLFQIINLILYKENDDFLVHRMAILNIDINFNSLICYNARN